MSLPDDTQAPEPEAPAEPEEAQEAPLEGQEEPPEEPAEGEEAKEGEAGEGEAAEAGAEGAEGAVQQQEAEEKRKRAGGWQRKIERLERQNAILAEQLARNAPPQAPAKADKDKTPEEKAAEWVDGLLEQRLAQREAQKRQQEVVAGFQRRTQEVRATKDDFDDVVASADIPVTSPLGQALLTSEHGPAIMYQLAKSPAELARISALPPLDAAREIGRLEAKLASSTPPAPTTTQTAKRPPAPPTSVNGTKSSTRSLEELSLSEYKRAYRSGRR